LDITTNIIKTVIVFISFICYVKIIRQIIIQEQIGDYKNIYSFTFKLIIGLSLVGFIMLFIIIWIG
jgi:hypothetical protein